MDYKGTTANALRTVNDIQTKYQKKKKPDQTKDNNIFRRSEGKRKNRKIMYNDQERMASGR